MANLYRHFSKSGELLYVGVSLSAIQRLREHRQHAEWFSEIARVEIEHFATRSEALQAEREAIKVEKPRYNVTHNGTATRSKSFASDPCTASA